MLPAFPSRCEGCADAGLSSARPGLSLLFSWPQIRPDLVPRLCLATLLYCKTVEGNDSASEPEPLQN